MIEVRCESVTHFVLLLSKKTVLLLGTSGKCTETTELLIYIKTLRIYMAVDEFSIIYHRGAACCQATKHLQAQIPCALESWQPEQRRNETCGAAREYFVHDITLPLFFVDRMLRIFQHTRRVTFFCNQLS